VEQGTGRGRRRGPQIGTVSPGWERGGELRTVLEVVSGRAVVDANRAEDEFERDDINRPGVPELAFVQRETMVVRRGLGRIGTTRVGAFLGHDRTPSTPAVPGRMWWRERKELP